MINAAGEFRETKLRQNDDRKQPAGIRDDGEDDRKTEDRNFLPQPRYAGVNVERCDHDNGNQGANAAATFCDIKAFPMTGNREKRRADGINGDPKQAAQCFNNADADKLEPECHLFDRAERNHEKEERDRKKENARDLFSPKKQDHPENEKRKSEQRDARLHSACADDVEKNTGQNKQEPEVAAFLRRGRNFLAMVPNQKKDDERN